MTGPDIHATWLKAGHTITDIDRDTFHVGPVGNALIASIREGSERAEVRLEPTDLPGLIEYLTAVMEAAK